MPDPQAPRGFQYDADGQIIKPLHYDADGNPVYESQKMSAWDQTKVMLKAKRTPLNPGDLTIGFGKGVAHTALTLGDLMLGIPGVVPAQAREAARAKMAEWKAATEPSNMTQSIGRGAEQVAEVIYPATKVTQAAKWVGSKLPAGLDLMSRVGIEAAGGAGLATAQGGDPTLGAALGGAGATVTGVTSPAMEAFGRYAKAKAPKLVLSAVKPTVTAMKQQANASRLGLNMTADRVARFIIANRLTTPEKAQAIIDGAEKEIRQVLQRGNALTDAPVRAERYLEALRKSASRQGIPKHDVDIIAGKIQDFMDTSPLTRSEQAIDSAGNPVFDKNGNPVMIRVLRDDVMADESLAIGRATSKFATKKQYGELKGMGIESDKAVERATRDAAKLAVPDLRAVLNREGKAITARQVLDRMLFRQGNTDPLSLTDSLWIISQVERGKLPTLGALNHWFRHGGAMRAGIFADRLANAISSGNARQALEVLALVAAAEGSKPMASHEPTR